MKEVTEKMFQESYRIGYKTGYKEGVKDALKVFKTLQLEHEFTLDDKEFYLALEDLKEGL